MVSKIWESGFWIIFGWYGVESSELDDINEVNWFFFLLLDFNLLYSFCGVSDRNGVAKSIIIWLCIWIPRFSIELSARYWFQHSALRMAVVFTPFPFLRIFKIGYPGRFVVNDTTISKLVVFVFFYFFLQNSGVSYSTRSTEFWG